MNHFDPAKFTIVGFCADCDHSAPVKTDEDLEIPTLIERLSCSVWDRAIALHGLSTPPRVGTNIASMGPNVGNKSQTFQIHVFRISFAYAEGILVTCNQH